MWNVSQSIFRGGLHAHVETCGTAAALPECSISSVSEQKAAVSGKASCPLHIPSGLMDRLQSGAAVGKSQLDVDKCLVGVPHRNYPICACAARD